MIEQLLHRGGEGNNDGSYILLERARVAEHHFILPWHAAEAFTSNFIDLFGRHCCLLVLKYFEVCFFVVLSWKLCNVAEERYVWMLLFNLVQRVRIIEEAKKQKANPEIRFCLHPSEREASVRGCVLADRRDSMLLERVSIERRNLILLTVVSTPAMIRSAHFFNMAVVILHRLD